MVSVGFGQTSTGGFAEALVYGADNGAQISSNSWGYISSGVVEQAVLDAIDYYTDSASDGGETVNGTGQTVLLHFSADVPSSTKFVVPSLLV